MAPKPKWLAALRKLPRAAPAASHCSRTGTRERGRGEMMKAISAGARVACSRARRISSAGASGSRRSFSCSNRQAKASRWWAGNSRTRQGCKAPWSGAHSAASIIRSMSPLSGPGMASRLGETERRASRGARPARLRVSAKQCLSASTAWANCRAQASTCSPSRVNPWKGRPARTSAWPNSASAERMAWASALSEMPQACAARAQSRSRSRASRWGMYFCVKSVLQRGPVLRVWHRYI